MRSTMTLMFGLVRDPALIAASLVLACGLALIAIVSLVVTWRVRWSERPRPVRGPVFDTLVEQPAL